MINNYIVNVADTSLYKEFLAMKEEIMKHKWYESEKAGYDIGFARALIDWTIKFKSQWLQSRKKKN
jgi:hypothetical protein